MLNPPFSQRDENLHELAFANQMLACLQPGGIGVVIVPISCAISPNRYRRELMARHTLEAVMSMPQELFYPVGVVTCVMVWTAGVPHGTSRRKTWFGYWRDDGFEKTKHKGRIDLNGKWDAIRDRWVKMFRNREAHPGVSVMAEVDEDSEWCAEAYMETDYSAIGQADFVEEMKQYAIFRIQNARMTIVATVPLDELFVVTYGNKFDLNKMDVARSSDGVAFVGRSGHNNGVSACVQRLPGVEPFAAGNITVALGGSKVLSSFVQLRRFYTAQNVAVLIPRGDCGFNEKVYYCMCIRLNRFPLQCVRKEANRTIGDLRVPANSQVPEWVGEIEEPGISEDRSARSPSRRSGAASCHRVGALSARGTLRLREGQAPYTGCHD